MRVVPVSTTALFDITGLEVANEDAPVVKGGDTYALSKTAPENHLRSLQDEGAPLSIVYPQGVIGPEDPGLSEAMRGIQQICRRA